LAAAIRRFRFTPLVTVLIAVHAVILLIGAHYTYAEVPLGHWVAEWLGWTRNHYDRLGHFVQGFVPAMVARELLVRTSPLGPGKWLAAVVVLACLGISASYEIVEWVAAEFAGDGAVAFLAMQGDPWDTQKDMALAGLGAVAALILLSGLHDRQMEATG
jgi:putative membrane protein